MDEQYTFSGWIKFADGKTDSVTINVRIPTLTSDSLYRCEIESNLLSARPYRVYSGLQHDAWAEAFEVLRQFLRVRQGVLVDEKGRQVDLPSPQRDRSWVPPPRVPNVESIEPIYRTGGWVRSEAGEKRSVELAIWPPFEEEPGTFCAPMRCGLMNGGQVRCSYGVSPEQAVHLAYKYLQIEIQYRKITDADGQLIEVPITPEPPLIAP
jgi:hypothetical protein